MSFAAEHLPSKISNIACISRNWRSKRKKLHEVKAERPSVSFCRLVVIRDGTISPAINKKLTKTRTRGYAVFSNFVSTQLTDPRWCGLCKSDVENASEKNVLYTMFTLYNANISRPLGLCTDKRPTDLQTDRQTIPNHDSWLARQESKKVQLYKLRLIWLDSLPFKR